MMRLTSVGLFVLLAVMAGCTTSGQYPRNAAGTGTDRLPDRIANYAIRAGMDVSQVQAILKLEKPVDVSRNLTVGAGPFDGSNPWSGFYSIEFQSNRVSRVMFHRGNLSVVTGVWILSEMTDKR